MRITTRGYQLHLVARGCKIGRYIERATFALVRWFAFAIVLACRSPARDEAVTSAEPHADPWSPERALLFTFTVEARQEQRLASPFHGPGGTWLYLAATAGGGAFGVLLPEYEQTRAGAGEIHELELVPTSEADGKRVVSAFVTAFAVDGPPFEARAPNISWSGRSTSTTRRGRRTRRVPGWSRTHDDVAPGRG